MEGLVVAIEHKDGKNGPYARMKVQGPEGSTKDYIAGKYSYSQAARTKTGDRITYDAKPSSDGSASFIGDIKVIGQSAANNGNTAPLNTVSSAGAGNGVDSDRQVRIELQCMYKVAGMMQTSSTSEAISTLAKELYHKYEEDVKLITSGASKGEEDPT